MVTKYLNQSRLKVALLVFTCACFWGLSFYATKVALAAGINEIELLSIRWSIGAITFVLMTLTRVVKVDFKGKSIRRAIYVAMLQPCFYSIFETWGIGLLTTSESSLFIATIPLMVLITGKVFFKKNFSRRTGISIIIALLGVSTCIVFADGFSFKGKFFGYLIISVAVLLGALYCHASAHASETFSAMEMTFVMTVSGAAFFNAANLAMGGRFAWALLADADFKVILAVIFLGICCSCICYIIFNYVLSVMNPAYASNLISNSTTAIGVISGIVLAGDSFGLYTIIGLLMTIGGIWLASIDENIDTTQVTK